MNKFKIYQLLIIVFVATQVNAVDQYNVGVRVSGLASNKSVDFLITSTNGNDTLTVSENGDFNFLTLFDDGTNVPLSITSQPNTSTPKQTCVNHFDLDGGGITIIGQDKLFIIVCETNNYNIIVNVTGLHDQNTVYLDFNNLGPEEYANGMQINIPVQQDGTTYNVFITPQPYAQPTTPNQTCAVLNGVGIIAGADVTVNVECTTNQYNIGVSVSGLAATNSIEFLNNGGDSLVITGNGDFDFDTPLDDESSFDVTIATQPTTPNQTCIVNNGSSQLAGTNNLVSVVCTTNQYNVNVTVSGLSVSNFTVLTNNTGDFLQIFANGNYTFATALFDESSYDVAVIIQPETPNQLCTVVNGSGNLIGTDVNIQVTCLENEFMIGGVVTGLISSNSLTLSLNQGAELLKIHFNQAFVFFNPVVNGLSYDISVFTNPTNPNQTCVVSNSSGDIIGADITDIQVNCSINSYYIGGTVVGLISDNYLVIQNNSSDSLLISDDGAFVFNSPVLDLNEYEITIESQPNTPIQTCSVINGNDSVVGFDISNVIINCEFGDDLIYRHGFENATVLTK